MIVQCDACDRKFDVPDAALMPVGRNLKCAGCGSVFFQEAPGSEDEPPPAPVEQKVGEDPSETPEDVREEIRAVPPEGVPVEDETIVIAPPNLDDWASSPDDLKEIDMDGDAELKKLFGGAVPPVDPGQEPDGVMEGEGGIDLEGEEGTDEEEEEEEEEEDLWPAEEEDPWPEEEELLPEEAAEVVAAAELLVSEEAPTDPQVDPSEEREVLPDDEEESSDDTEESSDDEEEEEPYDDEEERLEVEELAIVSSERFPAHADTEATHVGAVNKEEDATSSKTSWVLVALLLLILAAGLVFQTVQKEDAQHGLRTPYRLDLLGSQWRTHASGSQLWVQGEVVINGHAVPLPKVHVVLMDRRNNTLVSAPVVFGRMDGTRQPTSTQGLEQTQATEQGTGAGRTMPFQVVFTNPPAEAVHFRVDFVE